MDETPKKTKFSVSFVQKTPKKKKKEISKIRHLMSKVKEGVVVRQQVKSYDMKIVKKIEFDDENKEENLSLNPDFTCGKCNKVFNEFAKVMLHKKGSYLTCETEKERKKRKKRNAPVSEEDLKLKNFKENLFNQNKPILFQDCKEVRLGKFFVFFTLGMLCLGAAHLSKLCFSVL